MDSRTPCPIQLDPQAWGKLSRDDSGAEQARLGLLEHCIDVAAVTLALLQLPTVRKRLDSLAGRELNEVDRLRLSVLALFHDLGKAAVGFQSKALPQDQQSRLLRRLGLDHRDCGHTQVVSQLMEYDALRQRWCASMPVRDLVAWGGLDHLFAAISHHGEPITGLSQTALSQKVWQPAAGYDPWATLSALGTAAKQLFPAAFDPAARPLPDAPALVHAFAGLVSLADWIGSNPAADFFPYTLGEDLSRWAVASARAREVLRSMCIDVEPLRADLRKRAPAFGDIFRDETSEQRFEPMPIQRAMSDTSLGPLVIAEAETGSGKTEAALWRFKTLFEAGEVDSLAFVLPTRVAALELSERVAAAMCRLFPDPGLRPNVLLAVPGYLRVDGEDARERLANFEVLWPDSPLASAAHRRWAAENTKRYLAACCAVGTIDQVLLSGLMVRHAHLRGFALLRSLLVVDEVHSSDVYMETTLRGVLQRHRDAGGHALLLSATLGVCSRRAYLLGPRRAAVSLEDGIAEPYPCVSDRNGSRAVGDSDRSKRVEVALVPLIDAPERVAQRAVEAVMAGARVLVVRNTVAAALDTQAHVEALLGRQHPALFRVGSVVCPHHGRYAAADRRLMDARIKQVFGKGSPPGAKVLCGTQTLEQSLDIDADLLITDLVPMDVLLQRIGRLHRHAQRQRPQGFESPRAVVLVPEDKDLVAYASRRGNRHGLGLERPYADLLAVAATWNELEGGEPLLIPQDNRRLVERCTNWPALHEAAERRGGGWLEHWTRHVGAQRAKAQAVMACDWSESWQASAFPDDEQRIRTRLGNEAIRVPLSPAWCSPFGNVLTEVAVPAWMWPQDADVDAIAQSSANDGALSLRLDVREFVYGRLGLSVRRVEPT